MASQVFFIKLRDLSLGFMFQAVRSESRALLIAREHTIVIRFSDLLYIQLLCFKH